jgi:hypothetical protein
MPITGRIRHGQDGSGHKGILTIGGSIAAIIRITLPGTVFCSGNGIAGVGRVLQMWPRQVKKRLFSQAVTG